MVNTRERIVSKGLTMAIEMIFPVRLSAAGSAVKSGQQRSHTFDCLLADMLHASCGFFKLCQSQIVLPNITLCRRLTEFGKHSIILHTCVDESSRPLVSANDVLPELIVVDHCQAPDHGAVDREALNRIDRRQDAVEYFARRNGEQSGYVRTIGEKPLKHRQFVTNCKTDSPRFFVAVFHIGSRRILLLLVRHPNGDGNCNDRANSLDPSCPIRFAQTALPADEDKVCYQAESQKRSNNLGKIKPSNDSCHLGILT